MEHKTGIGLTVSLTPKKPSKNYTCFFILRHFGLFLIHLQSKYKATLFICFFLLFLLTKGGLRIIVLSFDRRWIKNNPKRLKIKRIVFTAFLLLMKP